MNSKVATARRSVFAKAMTLGAVMLLFLLLVTPGDAAPGGRAVSPSTTLAIQQALATNMVGLGGGGCSWINIPDWLLPRSPCKPPWIPGPAPWVPKPPSWIPGPPPRVPKPPWVPKPPVWFRW